MVNEVADYDAYEAFYSALRWFVGHLEGVAAEAAAASALHGHYNVAYEFWYFVGGEVFVVSDPLHLLPDDVCASLMSAIEAVKAVPEEARVWTTTVDGSLRNLSHPAWIPPRCKAGDAMRLLEPTIGKMEVFFQKA